MDITDYYKPSEALELITKVLLNEDPELSLIDAIRMGPIRTWVFHKQGRLRLKSRLSRTLIPSGLWWNLSEDLTRGDLRDHSALRVDLAAGRAHFLLVDGHREYLSGELQIHKAGFTRWLNGLEQSDGESHTDIGTGQSPVVVEEPREVDVPSPNPSRKRPAEQSHERWIARAAELKKSSKKISVTGFAEKISREEFERERANSKDSFSIKKTAPMQTIRRVLTARKSEWNITQES